MKISLEINIPQDRLQNRACDCASVNNQRTCIKERKMAVTVLKVLVNFDAIVHVFIVENFTEHVDHSVELRSGMVVATYAIGIVGICEQLNDFDLLFCFKSTLR